MASSGRAIVLALALILGATAAAQPTRTEAAVSPSISRFMDTYVTSDGRVLRLDQGNDIVSEGQAYAMLLAQSTGQSKRFLTIWKWTRDHLQRPDHLFSWHASGTGQVWDQQAATDADILIAWSMLRYSGPYSTAVRAEGRRIADAVLQHETTPVNGAPIPLAGPWAVWDKWVNPSYWMPCVSSDMARLTGNTAWSAQATEMTRLLRAGTEYGKWLPTDWGRIVDGWYHPSGAPGGDLGAQYGQDAARTPIFFAAGTSTQRSLAAAWWPKLQPADRRAALALFQDGTVRDPTRMPLSLVASSFTARAAGNTTSSDWLMSQARKQATSWPSYYGDVWVALGDAMRSGLLSPCRW